MRHVLDKRRLEFDTERTGLFEETSKVVVHVNDDLLDVVIKRDLQDQIEDSPDVSPLIFKSKFSLLDQPLSPINVNVPP